MEQENSHGSVHSFFSDHSQANKEPVYEDMDQQTPSDEGIGTQQYSRPFEPELFKDTTNENVYAIFLKTWDWNEEIQSEVKKNFEKQKDKIENATKVACEAKGIGIYVNSKLSDLATQAHNNLKEAGAWVDELKEKLRSTRIALIETNSMTKENTSELQKISETINKICQETKKRDEGCAHFVEEINNIKEKLRRTSLGGGSKFKSLAIDAGSIKNAGIIFTDDQLHFPHEFLDEFDAYFSETNAAERHKILAFKGVIDTKTRKSFLETVRNVQNYRELKNKFLDFYWDRRAQNEAMKACRYDFAYAEDLKDMANKMARWAKSLRNHRHRSEDEIIDILIGKTPESHQPSLREEGQTMDQFLEKLANLSKMQHDPENEVPIMFRRNYKRKFNDPPVPAPANNPRYTNKGTPSNEQLLAIYNLISQKAIPKNFNENTTNNYQPAQNEKSPTRYPPSSSNLPATTYPPRDKPEQKTILQNPNQVKNPNMTMSNPTSKPFGIDKNGNLTINRFKPKMQSNAPAAAVQAVEFDQDLDEYVVDQPPPDDLTDQVATCNMLNTIFADAPEELDLQTITAALQLMTTTPSDEEENSASGNESH
ncbi:unnamed protein product [Allacma fusca]|uniref:Uncharacterized protein n=1 Tax=Allacma fusca TaxID=39272 RepID=A0A8J2JHU0_9HEXA|nr:unnamed protein product [Allacma fusca]